MMEQSIMERIAIKCKELLTLVAMFVKLNLDIIALLLTGLIVINAETV